MSSLHYFKNIGLSVLGAIALAGCAVKGPIDQQGNKLDPGQLNSYAVAEVEIKHGFNAQSISSIDGRSVHSFCNMCFLQEINLKPGQHRIVVSLGFDAAHQLIQQSFNFPVEAGNRYTMLSNGIRVTKRDDPGHVLYFLASIAGQDRDTYYPPSAIAQFNSNAQMQRAEAEQRHIRNQPLVRRIGAHICRQDGQFMYGGYVERIAEDKVQIRVSTATVPGDPYTSQGGFQPHIIWDYPDSWDLCE